MAAPFDIEAALVTYLAPLGVPVATRVPNPRPDTHVRITRAGGLAPTLAQWSPTVLIECWAPDEGRAFALTVVIQNLLADATLTPYALDGIGVYGVQCAEPVNLEDPDADNHVRYQFTVQFRLRHNPAPSPT